MPNFIQKVLDTAKFKTPKYSAFPQPNEVKLSGRIGLRYPVQRWDLNPGDSIDVNLQQLTRFAPLAAPIMHNFRIDFHAIEIPDRLAIPVPATDGAIDGGFENFHNLQIEDVNRPTMPQVTFSQYVAWLKDQSINPIGTLLDYLGYPCFKDFYRKVSRLPFVLSDFYFKTQPISAPLDHDIPSVTYQGATVSEGDFSYLSFVDWLISYVFYDGHAWDPSVSTYGSLLDLYGLSVSGDDFDTSILVDYLLKDANLTSVEASKMWLDYIYAKYFTEWLNIVSVINNTPLSLKPLYDYWVAVYDWMINTNIEKPASKVAYLASKGLRFNSGGIANPYGWLNGATIITVTPEKSLWMDDYFTSAFDNVAAGGSVSLTGITNLQQLREGSAVDKIRMKLMYTGKRYWDQVRAFFGVEPSAALYDRCRVLGVAHFNMQVSDVTQTSQSDLNSNLGDFAGKAITVGSNRSFIHFTADEHTTIMVFMTVRPVAVYEQILPKDLLKVSAYDYLIPEMQHVGEQSINPIELYPDITKSASDVFAFQRRFAEYMFTPSHIHGEFGTSLDFWHDAREFDSMPALNKQFVSVDEDQDNLNRIFSVPGAKEKIYSFLYFDTVISRPLSKTVNYGF